MEMQCEGQGNLLSGWMKYRSPTSQQNGRRATGRMSSTRSDKYRPIFATGDAKSCMRALDIFRTRKVERY